MNYLDIDPATFGRDASFDPCPARTAALIEQDAQEAIDCVDRALGKHNLLPPYSDFFRHLVAEAGTNFSGLAANMQLRSMSGKRVLNALTRMEYEYSGREFIFIELARWPSVDVCAPYFDFRYLKSSARKLMQKARMDGWFGMLRLEIARHRCRGRDRIRPVFSAIAWADGGASPREVCYEIAGYRCAPGKPIPTGIGAGWPTERPVSELVRDLFAPPTTARGPRTQVMPGVAGHFDSYHVRDDLLIRQIEVHSLIAFEELLMAGGESGTELNRMLRKCLRKDASATTRCLTAIRRAGEFWDDLRPFLLPAEMQRPPAILL